MRGRSGADGTDGTKGPADSANDSTGQPEAGTAIVVASGAALARANASSKEAVRSYLLSLASENSQRTMIDALKRVVRTTRHEAKDYENFPWHRLRPEIVSAIRAKLLARPVGDTPSFSRATVLVSIAALRGVLKWCFALELMEADTYHRILLVLDERIRGGSDQRAGRMLEDDEIAALRRTCRSKLGTFEGAMYDAMLALALGAGLRRDELARAVVSDVSKDGRELRVLGKGNKLAHVPLPSWAAESLQAWLAQRARFPFQHERLFVRVVVQYKRGQPPKRTVNMLVPMTKWCVTYAVARLAKLAEVDFTPHDMRRTYISTMLDVTDGATAQRGARHSDPKTTFGYDRRGARKLAEAVEAGLAKWGKL